MTPAQHVEHLRRYGEYERWRAKLHRDANAAGFGWGIDDEPERVWPGTVRRRGTVTPITAAGNRGRILTPSSTPRSNRL